MSINRLDSESFFGKAQPAQKWDAMTRDQRIAAIRKYQPDGSWDFYADSTWSNLFGGVQDRLEKYVD